MRTLSYFDNRREIGTEQTASPPPSIYGNNKVTRKNSTFDQVQTYLAKCAGRNVVDEGATREVGGFGIDHATTQNNIDFTLRIAFKSSTIQRERTTHIQSGPT
jgi:hypothetical protein